MQTISSTRCENTTKFLSIGLVRTIAAYTCNGITVDGMSTSQCRVTSEGL
jgi:hypothetical protein